MFYLVGSFVSGESSGEGDERDEMLVFAPDDPVTLASLTP